MTELNQAQPETEKSAAAPAAEPAAKPASKRLVAKAAAKPAVKSAAKPAPKAVVKTPAKPAEPVKAAKPAKPAKLDKKPAKPARAKLVRDGFTMPEADFALFAKLKARAMAGKRETKKSELLRAGLQALNAMGNAEFLAALGALAPVQIGRPKKGH
jgi:uncharacterized protein YjhX (UPF0386 family)